MRTWADFGIAIPYGTSGEVRIPCPQCSHTRRKSQDACLAVNIEKQTWMCWHCDWRGGLHGPIQTFTQPPFPRPPARPDDRKRAVLRCVWGEAHPIVASDPVTLYLRQ